MYITDLNSVIFIDNLPTLDIHGFDKETARVSVNDFIKDNYKMKKQVVVIVHGKGTGILKNATKEALTRNKLVKEHKIYYRNDGCTLVLIDLTKKINMI